MVDRVKDRYSSGGIFLLVCEAERGGLGYFYRRVRWRGERIRYIYRKVRRRGMGVGYFYRRVRWRGERIRYIYRKVRRRGMGVGYFYRRVRWRGERVRYIYRKVRWRGMGVGYFYREGRTFPFLIRAFLLHPRACVVTCRRCLTHILTMSLYSMSNKQTK